MAFTGMWETCLHALLLKHLDLVSSAALAQLYICWKMFGLKGEWEENKYDTFLRTGLFATWSACWVKICCRWLEHCNSIVRALQWFFSIGMNGCCSRILFSFLLCLFCRSLLFFLCATLWNRRPRMCWGELWEVVMFMVGLCSMFTLCAHFLSLVWQNLIYLWWSLPSC